MKRNITVIIFLSSLNAFCQEFDIRTYIEHKSLESMILFGYRKDYPRQYEIKSVKEYRIALDSAYNDLDSTLVSYFEFDPLGQMTMKRFDYSKDGSKYRSEEYKYTNNNQKIDTTIQNLHNYDVLDGVYVNYLYPAQYCVVRDEKRIEWVFLEFKWNKNRTDSYELMLEYQRDLITGAISEENKKTFRHIFKYEYYSRYKH